MEKFITINTTPTSDRESFAEFEGKLVADIPALKTVLAAARIVEKETAEKMEIVQADISNNIKDIIFEFEKRHANLYADYKQAAENLDNADNELRSALIVWSQTTGEKTFDKQLSVRVTERLCYDAEDATHWARNNAQYALTVDKKQFDQIAKNQNLTFVQKIPSYSAVIATDLTNREEN